MKWLVWIFAAVIPFVLFLGGRPRPAEPPADVERHATIVEGLRKAQGIAAGPLARPPLDT
jgi:hypothetical protein